MGTRQDERAGSRSAGPQPAGTGPTVAGQLSRLVGTLFAGPPPVRIEFWDGSGLGPNDSPGSVTVRSPRALTRLLWSPDELGLTRAYIAGDIEFGGDLYSMLAALQMGAVAKRKLDPKMVLRVLGAARRVGALRPPPSRPAEEIRLRGARHSPTRDARAISHHYDVSNDFYGLVLGPSMTYSCARFTTGGATLEEAQNAKHELVCRKLGLHEHPGARLLDVGCGWGSMAIHAAKVHGARVTAITISRSQADGARRRVEDEGLSGLVDVRLQDYRELTGERFDAISSIGMFEHVGTSRMAEYFQMLHAQLAPGGRLLNHAISTPGGSRLHGRTFTNRYVFPDGELIDVADVIEAMERAGYEVRDVESLREHYATTLRAWAANLETRWEQAVRLVGEPRARIWRLYMAGSANGFADGDLAVHQVLGVVPDERGRSGMPATRRGWD